MKNREEKKTTALTTKNQGGSPKQTNMALCCGLKLDAEGNEATEGERGVSIRNSGWAKFNSRKKKTRI